MVGRCIKEFLTGNGIKQSYLSEKTGISEAAISRMLSGNQKIDVMDYFRICQALNQPMTKFIEKGG